MANLIKDIEKGRIKSAYVYEPFDIAKAELEKNNYKIISAEQNARLRIQEGKEAFVSGNGNLTREGFIYIPRENFVYFTFNSPIMDFPSEAITASIRDNPFYINEKQKEKALSKSIKINYKHDVPVEELHNDEVTAQIFGKAIKKYGEFLKDAGINEVSFGLFGRDVVDKQDNPFATQLWLAGLNNGSLIIGIDSGLNLERIVRGVLKKIKGLPYTEKDVEGAEREYNNLLNILQPNQVSKIGGLIKKL